MSLYNFIGQNNNNNIKKGVLIMASILELNNRHNAKDISFDKSLMRINSDRVQGAIDELSEYAGMTKINYLDVTIASTTESGVTLTVNADKSITVNGTPTTDLSFLIGATTLKVGTYTLSGCPEGGSISSYYMYVGISGVNYVDIGDGKGANDNGLTFNIVNDNTTVGARIVLIKGKNYNVTFYPMIRPSYIKDNTYKPYVYDLYSIKADKSDLRFMEIGGSNQANQPWINLKEKWSQIPVGFTIIEILAGSRSACLVWKMSEQYGEAIILGYVDGITLTVINISPSKWTYAKTTMNTAVEF